MNTLQITLPAVLCVWLVGPSMAEDAAAQSRATAESQSAFGATLRIRLLPQEILLAGPESRQRLIVQRITPNGQLGTQVTDGVELVSSDPAVVRVEDGIAVPAGNGSARITATAGGEQSTATVTVSATDQPQDWTFRNHVQSVLSKAGCNSGACHGAAAGKNGFRLSLRGYDPEFDYDSITRQAQGRRIVPEDPGRSLLLLKPTGAVPHKGGLRFRTGSREYQAIAEWLAAGHPAPSADDSRLERLEILPEHAVLSPESEQQMVVRAHFSDGRIEDVTPWVKYNSSNQSVASVNEHGEVTVAGSGEGAIVGWYLSNNVIATITVPFENEVAAKTYEQEPPANFIDELVLDKLRTLNLPPSPQADDSAFLRRAYLDTIGVLPTVEETQQFLADESKDKRSRLIDRLLSRPEFVDYWTYKWSDLLLVTGERLRPEAVEAYGKWIREQVAADLPWDEFVRNVVTARGSTLEHGEANFYALHQDPEGMTENVCQAFLGMSIGCARCHDHPLEKWTNDDYYGMVSLFARVRGKGWGGEARNGDGDRVVFLAPEGETIQPRTGSPQPPKPLDAEPLAFDLEADRREYLAEWLTDPENPYFTKAVVNRVWANFMTVGIVEAVDDMRLTNPPSNPELLDALAKYLVDHDFDLKALMRLILNSNTYQRSSETLSGNEPDTRFYSRCYPDRLPAEVLLDAVSQVTSVPTEFSQRQQSGGGRENIEVPLGTRALQLNDTSVVSYFLNTFGRPERLITCECERSDEPSMVQVLHILNGVTLNDKLSAEENRINELLAADLDDAALIDHVYLASLSRYPTDSEKERITAVLAEVSADEKRTAVEDLLWGILSSKEFLFNH